MWLQSRKFLLDLRQHLVVASQILWLFTVDFDSFTNSQVENIYNQGGNRNQYAFYLINYLQMVFNQNIALL